MTAAPVASDRNLLRDPKQELLIWDLPEFLNMRFFNRVKWLFNATKFWRKLLHNHSNDDSPTIFQGPNEMPIPVVRFPSQI